MPYTPPLIQTSAQLAAQLSDETGTGKATFATSPDITTGFTIGGAAANRTMVMGDGSKFAASTETYAPPGTNGNIFVSDGTNWVSKPRTMTTNTGTSTSGTNGTVVTRIIAGGGNQFINIFGLLGQSSTANTNMTLNVVYSDGTSTTDSTVYNTAGAIYLSFAGTLKTQSGQLSSVTALTAGKKVTTINVTTSGAGSGTRGATLAAEEIPLS